MWIGLLTTGAHPDRPAATWPLATLFVWGPQTRARIDGPQDGLAAGVRTLRASARHDVGTVCRPRCFACRRPYPLPDAGEIRADAGIPDLAAADGEDEDHRPADPDGTPSAPPSAGRRAVFALVHVQDGAPAGHEEEALVLVPSTRLAVLVPLDAIGPFAGLLGDALDDVLPPACDGCGQVMPGGSLGAPNRAGRRVPPRRRPGGDPHDDRRAA